MTRPAVIRVRHPIQYTAAQHLRARRRPAPVVVSDATINEHIALLAARPRWGETWTATAQDGSPTDEVDAGYLSALRLAPRNVGTGNGELPPAVADRLFAAGWIERVAPANR